MLQELHHTRLILAELNIHPHIKLQSSCLFKRKKKKIYSHQMKEGCEMLSAGPDVVT